MKALWKYIKQQWWFMTHTEFRSELTAEEFKKLWNDNLEEMKID